MGAVVGDLGDARCIGVDDLEEGVVLYVANDRRTASQVAEQEKAKAIDRGATGIVVGAGQDDGSVPGLGEVAVSANLAREHRSSAECIERTAPGVEDKRSVSGDAGREAECAAVHGHEVAEAD